jgi:endo-1,3(4)-beta-glucanase
LFADTYFSGKALGKLARIILVAEEVEELCISSSDECGDYLFTKEQFQRALTHLKAGVEIWLSPDSQAPFVYDKAWGGVISCGCTYSNGNCVNLFPNCPGMTDKLLNFGNAMYNDHHFHYAYHIYAFSTVAKFDSEWARQHYEKMLLLVRDYANPSEQDEYFTVFRHKDMYQGNSWANGIAVASVYGMNQESSSEAIASYEAVALFGKTMMNVFADSTDNMQVAEEIYKVGLMLTATELRSARRYYQVTHNQSEVRDIYPDVYEPNVVGILWSMMVHYGTWL